MLNAELSRGQQAEVCAETAAVYGYARTNRPDVNVERQHQALRDAGVREDSIYTDLVVSGRDAEGQTQLQALLESVQPGDTIVVDHLYRLGRDADNISRLLAVLKEREVMLHVTDHDGDSDVTKATCAVGYCRVSAPTPDRA